MPALIGNKGEELDILIRQGATFGPIKTSIADDLGNPINIEGAIVRGQVRKTYKDLQKATAEFETVISDTETGTFTWSLSAAVTTNLVAGSTETAPESQYVWDLEIEYIDGRVDPIFYGTAKVFREVTKADPL